MHARYLTAYSGLVTANNEILVTRDLEHFMRIKELRVEAW
jgi:predicted nucleic acid-binding protein